MQQRGKKQHKSLEPTFYKSSPVKTSYSALLLSNVEFESVDFFRNVSREGEWKAGIFFSMDNVQCSHAMVTVHCSTRRHCNAHMKTCR
jgi:hypothetical protein